jgi:RNA polymerase sigma factor (sigma-70 family)
VEHQSQAAFNQLIQRHLDMVFATCRREVSDADLAEDVSQVVFLTLARKAHSLRGSGSLAGWLFVTARLASKNALRHEARRRRKEHEAFMQMESDGAETQHAWEALEPQLHSALSALKDAQRAAILLRFFENKSLKETGTSLGVSEDAARMLVNRAVEKMRRVLTRKGTTVSATVLSTLLAEHAAQAAPAKCVESVLAFSSQLAAHGAQSLTGIGAAQAKAHEISQGVLRDMMIAKTKSVATVALLTAVVLGGSAWSVQQRSSALAAATTGRAGATSTGQNTGVQGNEFLPRLRLKEGATFRIRVSSDQTISLAAQGKNVDVLRMIDVVYKCTVHKVAANGDATLQVNYESLYLMEKSPAMTVEYDSSQPRPITPLARYLGAVVGQSLTVTLSPMGRVVEIQGVPAMLEKLKTEQAKAELPAQVQEAISKSIEQGFGEASTKAGFEMITEFYPQSPIKVGESWSDERVENLGEGRIKREDIFTLVSRKNGRSQVKSQGTSTIDPDSAGLQIGLAGTCKDGQGSGTITMEVDEASGWPVSSEMRGTLSGSLEPLSGARPGAPTMQMTIKSRSRVSIT